MTTPWDTFFKEKITAIFTDKRQVLDIGGGLRVVKEKNNRYEKNNEWIRPLLERVDYKIMDPVDTYHPDIVGDIHHLPFADNTQEAIICIAVLEHVENPILACSEMHRALKPGGYCFIYVPFLYYYHAEAGYYGDYWRFTKDTLAMLFKDYSHMEMQAVRGPLETLVRLSPLGRYTFFSRIGYWLDRAFGKLGSNQVSGYFLFAQK